MERFSQRESVLLGYSPQPAFRHKEIDFGDVFGGPPRRSSLHEVRGSFGEALDSNNNVIRGREGRVLCRSSLSGLNEVPVFGEESMNRRRCHNNDFFDDIFGGDEPLGSPRKAACDAFGLTPGSRVSSPLRGSVPPRADTIGSALPGQFQFSPYKHKDPTSNRINGLHTPLSRAPSKSFQEEDELRKEVQPSCRLSPLFHELPFVSKKLSHTTKADECSSMEMTNGLKKDLKKTEAPTSRSQFQFSMCNWAKKGLPLSMPVKGGNNSETTEKIKPERCSVSNGRIEIDMMTNNEGRKQDKSTKVGVEPDIVLSVPVSKSIYIPDVIQATADNVALSDKREETKPKSMFHDNNGAQGNDEINRKLESGEGTVKKTTASHSHAFVKKNMKKNDEEGIMTNREVIQINEPLSGGSSRISIRNHERNEAEGKVKEFIEIFNQGATSKPKHDIITRSPRSQYNKGSAGATRMSQTTGENHIHNLNKMRTLTNGSFMEEKKRSMVSEQQQSNLKATAVSAIENSFRQKDVFKSSSESLAYGSKITIANKDESFREDIRVKELLTNQDNRLEKGKDYEDIQALDAKIQHWSNGKEENIRSLLSTLQYVSISFSSILNTF
ncbi:hypothetical protein NMG60_11024326 [Bertholletia excelsa]